jgi:hypothetical protein
MQRWASRNWRFSDETPLHRSLIMKGDDKLKYGVRRLLPDGTVNPEWTKRAYHALSPERRAEKREYFRLWQQRNRKKVYASVVRWRTKNREKHLEYGRKNKMSLRQRKPEQYWTYMRKFHLKRSFGMTVAEYEALLKKQDYKCTICGEPHVEATKKRLQVDHCHKTGKVRELLCHHCNNMLGWAKDNIQILEKGIEYLKRHGY